MTVVSDFGFYCCYLCSCPVVHCIFGNVVYRRYIRCKLFFFFRTPNANAIPASDDDDDDVKENEE